MAPTRKSRSVNKRYSDYVEVSPSKNVANKSGRQKRKLSDMLGSPWTDEEVERFYKAYRKYGKDWKKVAAMVRTRNSEMVEALYTMNRAYLSLPEGTASVVGFIAMVSDHYNAMEGSDNDQESHDIPKPIHKPKKRSHGLLQQNGGEEQLHSRLLVGSSGRSLPQLKRRESDGCTVRKRTPRFPINHSSRRDNNNIGNYLSPYKRSQRREVDDVAHGAALALTEASQRGGSPHVSQSPYHMKSTPLKGRQKILDTVRTKRHGNLIDEELFEGSSGSGGAENEGYQKGRKFYGQKDDNDLDDGGEACSGTGEGLAVGVGGKFDENIEHSSQGKRKKNKKLLFRDETSALDALQTLADLSLMIQSSKGDDSPVLKEDKPATGTNDNNAPGRPGSTSNRRHKTKVSVEKEKVANEFPRGESSKSGKSKPGREVKVDYKALSEGKQKRKNKSTSFEVFIEEEKPTDKLLHSNSNANANVNAPLKNSKSTRLVEYSSSNSNTSRTGADSAVSTAVVPASDGVELPSKRRKKRKMDRNIISKTGEMKLNTKSETLEGANNLKEKAFHCLSSSMVRRWCTYEWFYSAIDYPWFAKREFVEYLNHVGLGHIPRLTNVEWGVIRSSLGKPRRFSENFLREERGKLWQYRESVREHYTELRSGAREGLPTDLARPLSVGQRVIALHPELREVHDGSVLTVDNDKCRVQFDRPELGVAFVKDVDCMPLNLLDNMPEALRREMSALYRFSMISGEPRLPHHHLVHTSSEHFEPGPTIALMNHRLGQNGSGAPLKAADNVVISQHQHAAASQIQARETDIHALSELTRALDKKEAILKELKLVNDSLSSHKNETGVAMNVSESFKKEYAMVLLQLKEASDQVASALANLRRRNTYPGIAMPTWQKPNPNSGPVVDPTTSNHDNNFPSSNQLAPNVIEILKSSRNEAHKLVHTALQGMSKIKEEHNNNVRSSVVAVLHCLGVGKNPSEHVSSSSSIRSSEQSNGNIYNNKRVTNETEAKIPFDLIVSCVATYHMIQSCTERQYPPGDVVQMLDSAFRNLHPQSPQNLGIFREIEMCMGRVKTQILALVPS
ncbi:hypothetical protein Lser_V15G44887 [Lactuca serriola]